MRTVKTLFPIGFGLIVTFGLVFRIAQASQAAQPNLPTATTLYVDADASGAATGLAWTDAYTTVQDALAIATSGDQVWVAEGVYYPDEGIGQVNDFISSAFVLTNGVALYGGFDPQSGADAFDERDWDAYPTVLSGDIDHETQPDITDSRGVVIDTDDIQGNNVYHVVFSSGVTVTAMIDGFTITAGQADDYEHSNYIGGGMYNDNSSLTLANVIFSGNSADNNGGGMYNSNGSQTLTNVTFSGNSADYDGGGMYNDNNSPTLANVSFFGNSAIHDGGGIYNANSNPVLTDVTFLDNSADEGGGMYNSSGNSILTNVTFSGNWALFGGGMFNTNSSSTLINVTFSNNSTEASYSGGMYNGDSSSTLTNVVFSNNDGVGMYNWGSDPILINVTFSGNHGVGMINEWGSSPTLTNVVFSGNSGGGMSNINNSSPNITNVIFSGNSSSQGGGMCNDNSGPILTNVIFFGNSADYDGGGMSNNNFSYPRLTNTIFWGNTAATGNQIYNDYWDGELGSVPYVSFSDIEGSGGSDNWDPLLGFDGGGNIDVDPLFRRNPDPGPDGNWDGVDDDYGDLRLQPGSPAIDSGTNDGCPATDLDGTPRPVNTTCDMGPYETGYGLVIDKAVNDINPKPGQTITFTLVVTNPNLDVTGGMISDTLPTGLNFLGPIILEPVESGSVGTVPPILASGLTLSYTDRVTVTFPVTVSYGLLGGFQLINVAAFSATEVITPVLSSITVTVQNVAPLVVADGHIGFSTSRDTAFTTANVLDNDSDPNGDALFISALDSFGTLGLVTNNGDGTFNYDPNSQFDELGEGEQGIDVFIYTVSDNFGGVNMAAVTITLNGVNDVPFAVDDSGNGFITDEDTAFTTANVLGNDNDLNGDILSVSALDSNSLRGLITDNRDGTFSYDPNGQFDELGEGERGIDVFTYTVSDDYGGMDMATVTITINGINDAPIAVNDSGIGFTTDKNTPFTTNNVLANDSDLEGDTLTILELDASSTQGLVTDNGDGTFVYNPNGQFDALGNDEQATDTFTYTVSDGNGGTDTATVTITILGASDAFRVYLPLVMR